MPELPDVEVYRREIDPAVLGRRVETVSLGDERVMENRGGSTFRRRLKGARFDETKRLGKHLLLSIEGDGWLGLHFGMTGDVRLSDEGEKPDHAELALTFDDGGLFAFVCVRKFGRYGLYDDLDAFHAEHALGPDALDADWTDARFAKIFEGRDTAVKSALTDQSRIAGVGNVWADEILYQARLRPDRPAKGIDRNAVGRLRRQTARVLEKGVERGADVKALPESWLGPHREKGGECPRCGTKIEKIEVSGRAAWFCPECQE